MQLMVKGVAADRQKKDHSAAKKIIPERRAGLFCQHEDYSGYDSEYQPLPKGVQQGPADGVQYGIRNKGHKKIFLLVVV
jgi:hypothetical protein